MTTTFLSSGDLIVDRRAHYAQMLAEAGEFSSAADLMEQALNDAPGWAAGWMMAGDYHLKADALGRAIAAWQRAAEHDPAGTLGAQMHLAAHGVGEVEPQAQAAYVEALFDQYAGHFEEALLQKLDYIVPGRLADLVGGTMEELGIEGFARGLDLGCGTGLMGERLRHVVSHLSGVDISAAMVAETQGKGIYDGVERAELLDFLGAQGRIADIVTAADVFMYCPALPPIFALVSQVLRPGGIFAFSVERHDGADSQWLQASLRFAHNGEAIRAALDEAGLDIVRVSEETIRRDRGQPVTGLLFVARKPENIEGLEVSDIDLGVEMPVVPIN
ncbi:methyltransferase domain-containing protein [Pelagibacterium nitratireducens]|uniref:Methyltransferase domain-containing protein n=1 Tax=Pelagibacterium nitratireducens TaxID=1046114 RepID=A0ABZ2I7W1_9HYPH